MRSESKSHQRSLIEFYVIKITIHNMHKRGMVSAVDLDKVNVKYSQITATNDNKNKLDFCF